MQVVCIKAFGLHEPGDTVELPDGAAFDPEHYQPAAARRDEPPKPPAPVIPAAAIAPKEF